MPSDNETTEIIIEAAGDSPDAVPVHKVFVGNLSFDVTAEELREQFAGVATVLDANIIKRGNRSLGYGFVEFGSIEDAEKAVSEKNQQELNGRPINVEIANPRTKTKAKRKRRPRRRGGKKTAEGEETAPAGDKDAGEQPASAEKKPRRRARHPRREVLPEVPSTTTLFVANLPFKLDNDAFLALFKDAGLNPTTARVVSRHSGASKGYGFVEFATEEEQKAAQEKMHGTIIDERELNVRIAHSERKDNTDGDADVNDNGNKDAGNDDTDAVDESTAETKDASADDNKEAGNGDSNNDDSKDADNESTDAPADATSSPDPAQESADSEDNS